jgi:DNA-binding beta-propeller fold protein YncE
MVKIVTRRNLLAAAVASVACRTRSNAGFSGFAFVANEDGHAVAVVDMSALAVVRHVGLNAPPTQLIAHAARPVVYALTPVDGAVHEIGTDDLKPRRRVQAAPSALGMRLDRSGEAIWVLTSRPCHLARISLDSLKVERRIPLSLDAVDFDLSLDAPLAAVSYGEAGSIAFIDLAQNKAGVPIPAGSPVRAVRFRKDGRQAIAAHASQKLLTFFDVSSARVVVRLPLAVRPDHLCFKADGGQLFVTGEGMDAVAIVYPYATQVAETILAGNAPGAMAVSPESPLVSPANEFLFVANPHAGQVTILNIGSRRVLAAPSVGAEPGSILITPDNLYALVLNRKSGDVAVLLIQSSARRRRFPAAVLTMIPVGSKPVSAVVREV